MSKEPEPPSTQKPRSWLKRNWQRMIGAVFWAIVGVFGSLINFLQSVQDFLTGHLTVPLVTETGLLVIVAFGIFRSIRPRQVDFKALSRTDSFHGRVERNRYELEQVVFFIVNFKGKLRAGYYESVIIRPDGQKEYSWDPQTLHFPRNLQRGEINREVNDVNYRWGWPIPMGHPLGEYTAHIGVYDCYSLDWPTEARIRFRENWLVRKVFRKELYLLAQPPRPPIDQETVRFNVVKRLPDSSLDVSTGQNPSETPH